MHFCAPTLKGVMMRKAKCIELLKNGLNRLKSTITKNFTEGNLLKSSREKFDLCQEEEKLVGI